MARSPAVELAPRVYRIRTLGDYINSFAFVDADGSVTLVDTGLTRTGGAILAGLAAIGRHPRDVTRIVLTHAHFDHAGSAARMLAETGLAGVAVHEADTGYVRAGQQPPGDPRSTAARLIARLPLGGFPPAAVGQALHDGDVLDVGGGLRVHHTPGHTPGHVALLHEPSGVLITGDSIFNMRSRISWCFPAACTNIAQNAQTAHVLGELTYTVAAFTHGPEIRDGAREAVRGFLRRHGA